MSVSLNSNNSQVSNESDKLNLDYTPNYKVNVITDGHIKKIYIFNGINNDSHNKSEYNLYFTEDELKKIELEKTEIIFCAQKIHYDDSIGTIKIKILNELKNSLSIEEIYLFCRKIETLNSVSVYQSLTQNKKIELTQIRVAQFMSNIISYADGSPVNNPLLKDVYTFEDILEMKLDDKQFITNKVLGQKFFIVENEYPFVCDPYDVVDYDDFFERASRKSLTTLNSHLLLNTGKIVNNNIYLCVAEDVLQFIAKKNISQEKTIKIYYPFLYNKNINELDELKEQQQTLIAGNKQILNDKTIEVWKTIDMFYEVYKNRKNNLNYNSKGIKYVKAILKPDFDINIPLEIIFKIVHATELNPLIKYNPSSRQENVYRLYTDKIATDGRKIPFLNQATILKLMRNIGKTKSVCVYIQIQDMNKTDKPDKTQTIICEFDENGYITISAEFDKVISIQDIDLVLKNAVNPIIEEIKKILEQSGYKLKTFNSLLDENVEVVQMTYESKLTIEKNLDIEKYMGCVSAIFNNETNQYKNSDNIILRFKRVSNFNKVTSQEAFVLEKSAQKYRGDEIIDALLENFPEDLTRPQAVELVRKIANEIQLERGVKKTDIKIKDNPGFKTLITLNTLNGVITISVENINDINYLFTIPIYLDSIIRLTQDKNSTTYPIKLIDTLCSSGLKEEYTLRDIISSSESQASENEVATIDTENENIEYQETNDLQKDKPKNAFSLFYEDDDAEEEDINNEESDLLEGGDSRTEENSSSGAYSSSKSSRSSVETDETDETDDSIPLPIKQTLPNTLVFNPSTKSSASTSTRSNSSRSSVETDDSNGVENTPLPVVVEKQPNTTKSKQIITDSDSSKVTSNSMPLQNSNNENKQQVEVVRNIDGMKLNKPYYFQTLIENKDPILILKEDTKKFNAYSRTCSSDTRRQPVILTDAELQQINKEHPNFLRKEDVIKYGSNPKKQFNYICPRYWCLKNNTIVDPKTLKSVKGKDGKKELESPNCGKVLPKGSKTIKPGYYIYEFYNEKEQRYPGFQTDKHPDGFCLPCCFNKYNTIGRINAKEHCEKGEALTKKGEKYILETEFPLSSGRWGYLPIGIQKILHEVNADCQVSKFNTNIKENTSCLLRHGIENNNKQSFIACISDVLFFGKKDKKILTISEMKQVISSSLNVDSFIKYQNGNLVTDFHDVEKNVDLEKYNETKLYSKLNMRNEEDKFYFKKVISAFENFKLFLKDDNVIIDHTYLWDIITTPNKNLFPNGVNLVIFQIPNDDITNNIQILCPTNHYSTEFYQARKPTIFLMKESDKEGEYYEPIYSYMSSNNIVVTKEFKEYDPHLSSTMRAVLKEIIKPFFTKICKPLESMPNIYKMKRPLMLYDLIQILDKYKYDVLKQVVNFNNKVIGVIAKEPGVSNREGFVPCYPSAINDKLKPGLDFVFMTDLSLWNDYVSTIIFLRKLYERSKKKRVEPEIPCKPAFKIVEDELIVGILTETNQFIQISEPISQMDIDVNYDIPSIKNDNYIINAKSKNMTFIDVPITTSNDVDEERVDYIKKIKLETNFYNVFRNTIRILLNDYNHIRIRESIETELNKKYIIYSEKLQNVNAMLRDLVKDKIQFTGDSNYYKLIKEVSTCIVKDEKTCSQTPNLCAMTENGDCNLILPEKNLLTNKKNESIYYGKTSDELIRYNRIKSFMFQPQTYISFGNITYNLTENEIILIQSMLTPEYFESLIPAVINKYVNYNSYDEAEPVISQTYDNKIASLDSAIGKENAVVIEKVTTGKITSGFWKTCFPNNYKEVKYSKCNYCTFKFIIDLIEIKTGEKLTQNQVRNSLYEEYKKYLPEYENKIVDILIIEGKKTLGDQVNSGLVTFNHFIFTDNYFLTTFDLWILVNKYKLPTIFISQKFLLQTNYKSNCFIGYGDKKDKFAFIVIPGLRTENIPIYKLIKTDKNDVFISYDIISHTCDNKIEESFKQENTIEEFLRNFIKKPTTIYEKKKPPVFNFEDKIEEEPPVQKAKRGRKKQPVLAIEEPLKPVMADSSSPPLVNNNVEELPKKRGKKTKKIVVKGGKNNRSKKNVVSFN